jgi:aspartyl-tRNA(Asn)/glutamyl-tRNA(Gln) amidotransferase subunit C
MTGGAARVGSARTGRQPTSSSGLKLLQDQSVNGATLTVVQSLGKPSGVINFRAFNNKGPILMKLSKTEILRIAALARIALDEAAIESCERDLGDILGLVEQVQRAPTYGVEPLSHPLDLSARLRADAITEIIDRDHLQQTAPATERGLYLVPRVID